MRTCFIYKYVHQTQLRASFLQMNTFIYIITFVNTFKYVTSPSFPPFFTLYLSPNHLHSPPPPLTPISLSLFEK